MNYLFFADDSLLFYRANSSKWNRMVGILQLYEVASGQKLNTNKTTIFFSRNTPVEEKEAILRLAAILES